MVPLLCTIGFLLYSAGIKWQRDNHQDLRHERPTIHVTGERDADDILPGTTIHVTGELEADDILPFAGCLEGLPATQYAVVTLLTSETYAHGAFALGRSIQEHLVLPRSSDYQLIAMVQQGRQFSDRTMDMVRKGGWTICEAARIEPANGEKVLPQYQDQFTKFGFWTWEVFDRIVYLDSDCLVVQDISGLITAPRASFAAVRDWTAGKFQGTFNMGVFSLRPNVSEFRYFMEQKATFVGYNVKMAEQGFLNGLQYHWEEFPFDYNGGIGMFFLARDEWLERADSIRIFHFTRKKPFIEFKDDLGSGVDPACADIKGSPTTFPMEYWKCLYEEWILE